MAKSDPMKRELNIAYQSQSSTVSAKLPRKILEASVGPPILSGPSIKSMDCGVALNVQDLVDAVASALGGTCPSEGIAQDRNEEVR